MRVSNGERGSVIIMVAIAMLVFLGFSALTVDAGYLYFKKTELQGYADAAALAAGKEFDGVNQNATIAKAVEYAEKNGLIVTLLGSGGHTAAIEHSNGAVGYMDVTFPNGNVKVVMNTENETFFARVLGSNASTVAVSAVAGRGNLTSYNGENLVPIAVEDRAFVEGQEYNLNYGPGDGSSGNYGYVNLDTYLGPEEPEVNMDKSVTNFSSYLKDGYDGDVTSFEVGGTFYTNTGVAEGHIKPAFNNLPRIVVVPIVETLEDMSGTSERITIIGFARFEITEYIKNAKKEENMTEEEKKQDKIIVGKFLEMITLGPSGSQTSDYLAQAVRLIE